MMECYVVEENDDVSGYVELFESFSERVGIERTRFRTKANRSVYAVDRHECRCGRYARRVVSFDVQRCPSFSITSARAMCRSAFSTAARVASFASVSFVFGS